MEQLDQAERTRIAENARKKFVANQAINHPDALVYVQEGESNEDGRGISIQVWLPRNPEIT